VAKHPAKCPKCGRRLEYESAVDEKIVCPTCQVLLSVPGKVRPSDKVDPLLGQTLGEFEIVATIGHGGMGAVYKGRQAALNRFVAIKVLPEHLTSDAAFIERFHREARAVAAVRHPNIIEVHTIGSERGHEFIAMEFVDGESLADLLRREGRLAPDRAVELMTQVASALADAHAAGIFHRDIKPANILLDARGRVKVADFGLAKHEGVDVSVTATGASLGTPLYMPPEVAQGKPADARSDLYSLGATFYQAIAGKPPFDGATPAELIIKHVNATPPPLQTLAPDCPAPLCRILHRLLSKNPAHRYSTADKLLAALSHVEAHVAQPPSAVSATRTLPGHVAQARAPVPHGKPVGGASLPRVFLIGGGAIALALVVVLFFVLRGSRVAQPPTAVVPPGTQHPTPASPVLEQHASLCLQYAETCAKRADWAKAKEYLDDLAGKYASTRFAADNKPAIAALRAETLVALKPTPTPKVQPKVEPKTEPKAEPPPDDDERWAEWEDLFDGKTLKGWTVLEAGEFAKAGRPEVDGEFTDRGKVAVRDGAIYLQGHLPGIAWKGGFPQRNYEVRLEACSIAGGGHVCEVAFPVGSAACALDIGGWGGTILGLQQVDGKYANSEQNPTWRQFHTQRGKWYLVCLRVTGERVQAWLDGQKVVDLLTRGHALSLAPWMQEATPFGLAACIGHNALRSIRLRRLRPEAPPPDDETRWGPWEDLFDGKTLKGWRMLEEGVAAKHGQVQVKDGQIALERGDPATLVVWTGDFPTSDYEVMLEEASFEQGLSSCNVTLPVGPSHCVASFQFRNYRTAVVQLNDLDGGQPVYESRRAASQLKEGEWHRLRLRVADGRLRIWLDDEELANLPLAEHTFGLAGTWTSARPFGIHTWQTNAALRSIRLRRLNPEAPPPDDEARWGPWEELFDGKTLDGWKVAEKGAGYTEHGEVRVQDGRIVLGAGEPLTGIAWTGEFPKSGYEVRYEAMPIVAGADFASIYFPVGDSACVLIVASRYTGLDCVDGLRHHENGTVRKWASEVGGRWYAVRLRVTASRIEAWVDQAKVIDLATAGRRFSTAGHDEAMKPFGLMTYRAVGAVRTIRLRRLKPEGPGPAPEPPRPEPKGTAKEEEDAKKKQEEERQRQAEAEKRDALARAQAAYAQESDKVWALFNDRKYDEADKLLSNLPQVANLREVMDADREAVKLLRDFWAAVEQSLAAKKGRFLAFGGAGGSIAEVKDGQVTLRSGRAEVTLPIHKLAAKQALAYAEFKDDERSNLMTAVVLLADDVALDEARAALDNAGAAPSVAIYRQRLDALGLGAAEAAAKAAWLRIEEEAKGKLSPGGAKRLTDMLAAFDKQHGNTKLYKELGEEIAAVKLRIEDSLGYTKWPFDEAEAKRRQKAAADALGVKVEEEIDLGGGVKMTMVLIPAGEFLMGSPPTTSPEQIEKTFGKDSWNDYTREFPQHRVKISRPFWLGKTEVTQAQWEAVMGDNPSKLGPRPQNPVGMVSWDDCQGFVQKLSVKFRKPFRLATEAEWEYACRAGSSTEFYFGDSQAALPQHAWFNANSGRSAQPVGKTKPNAWGLYDMAGNVWEWCEDWYAPYDKAAQVDPGGPGAGAARVLRGAAWGSVCGHCRSADRCMQSPTSRYEYVGCRVCVVAGATASDDGGVPAGFVALFNGKDLTGWKADERARQHWTVEDGVLVFDGKGENLCTARQYGDFELYLEWKIAPGGDSGIYLRGCPQVQIWDKPVGSGGLFNNQKHPAEPLVRADRPVGQWNAIAVRMVGERVSVKLNGRLVVDNTIMENYNDRGKSIPSTGSIELQKFAGPLYFRRIYIRELPPGR